MSYHTSITVLSFGDSADYSAIIPDSGASVAVEFWNGNEYVTDPKSPISTPATIFTKNNKIRLTPSNGGFYIDEGSRL